MSGYKTMIQTLFTKDVQKDFYAELNELAKMSRSIVNRDGKHTTKDVQRKAAKLTAAARKRLKK